MIRIEIFVGDDCPYEDVQKALETQMQAIGFVRDVPKAQARSDTIDTDADYASGDTISVESTGSGATASVYIAEGAIISSITGKPPTRIIIGESADAGAAAIAKPTAMDGDRERGKAGPGHRRRTNEQIKADDAYFAAHPQPASLAPGAAEAPLISTGEERISPEDAADEAAETAARAGEKLTIEDLRAAVGRYTEAFGAKASIDNIRTIIGKPMIEVAPEDIAAAIARVEAATKGEFKAPGNPTPAASAAATNSASQETATAGQAAQSDEPADLPLEPVHATKADVVEAIMAYGKKYDGVSDDPKKMPCTTEDMPKIFVAAFGAGVVGLKTAPQTPEGYGKAMTAVYAAVRDNPFKRTAK